MSSDFSLTIVGLGPGPWQKLTLEADSILRDSEEAWVRTRVHPSLDRIETHFSDVRFHSFDHVYEALDSYDAVYASIVNNIDILLRERGHLVYAVPGSPSVGETTVRLLLERFRGTDVRVRVVEGISDLATSLDAAGITDAGWLQVIDGEEAALMGSENPVGEVPGIEGIQPWRAPVATAPLLLSRVANADIASGCKLWLGMFYPDEHEVVLLRPSDDGSMTPESLPLFELDRRPIEDHRTTVYVPPLSESENVRTFAGMMQLTRRLRAPRGCPWDREQTHDSLKPHLLEETYEVLDALDSGDTDAIAEELGDLLYQITLHSQVAAEAGEFTIEDVIQNIMVKMIGRHPHVFGDTHLETAQEVRQVWEALKQRQKPKRTSVFEGIPRGLPALPQSNLMQKRAANLGFEWPSLGDVQKKVDEELRELRAEIDMGSRLDRTRDELGDVLFALISVARHLHIDPEEALRGSNAKFAARFQFVERSAGEDGKTWRDLSPADIDSYWNRAKEHFQEEA